MTKSIEISKSLLSLLLKLPLDYIMLIPHYLYICMTIAEISFEKVGDEYALLDHRHDLSVRESHHDSFVWF